MTRSKPILLLLALLLHAGVALGATGDTTEVVQDAGVDIADTVWSDLKAAVVDGGLLFTAPLRFGRNDWLLAGGLVSGTGLTMLVDEDLRELFSRGHDSIRDRISIVGNTMGTLLPGGILVGTLYIGGLVFDEPSVRLAGRHAGQALLYAGTINGILKALIGRHRPFLNDGAFTFRGPTLEDRYQALPSGHTTIAFALASSLAADIDNPWATVGLYGLATVTALSRIYDDRHWGSDVLLAAGLSAACGYGVVHLHDLADDAQGSFYLLPGPGSLTVGWRF
jgi:hypothetical protein